jgi:hypothetical protein
MLQLFIQAVRNDPELQQQMRGVTTAAGLAEVAAKAGLDLDGASIIKAFAQMLVDADDALAVRNFDNLGWDIGELLWATKMWEQSNPD